MKILIIVILVVLIGFAAAILSIGIMLPKNDIVSQNENDRFVNVNGNRIRYRVTDHGGNAIIFLHGFGENYTIWEPFIKSLSCGKAYALDLIGFGLSDRTEINYNLETHSLFLLGFMDNLGIDKAILVGSSMGASIALWSSAQYPERINSIVVFAPSAYPGSMHHHWPGDLIYRPNLLNRFLCRIIRNGLYRKLFPRSLAQQALDVTASYDQTFVEALQRVQQPVLLIWSEGDKRVPYEYNLKYREIMNQAEFVQAPTVAGHSAAQYPLTEVKDWICTHPNRADN